MFTAIEKKHERYARVKVEAYEQLITIPVSHNKPDIPAAIEEKWQKLIDLTADILGVPSGLITRFTPDNLEVYIASRTDGNPYKKDDFDQLGIGMFCESVVGKKEPVLVENTETSDYWRNHPHAAMGMHSYLGVPIEWHDGELFGTFCVLDTTENSFSPAFVKLIQQFRDLVETDLQNVMLMEELKEQLSFAEYRLRDVHHRLKNQFNTLISYISLRLMESSEASMEDVLTDIKYRTEVMATIHDEICRSVNLDVPSLDVYIPLLCRKHLQSVTESDIVFEYEIERHTLPMKDTVTLGLILSELVTNSVKHAFEKSQEKKIKITVKRSGKNQLHLIYRDNGRGLSPDIDPEKSESIGMTLIHAFVKQMKGSINIRSENGAVFEFKLIY